MDILNEVQMHLKFPWKIPVKITKHAKIKYVQNTQTKYVILKVRRCALLQEKLEGQITG